MKTFTVGVLSLATLAAAQGAGSIPSCAIDCFQGVITDHPPLECKEADMFHCFCKDPFGPDLQRYFAECARTKCDSSAQAEEAIAFGVGVCGELGFPITVTELVPPTAAATTSAAAQETSAAAETTSEAPAAETSSEAAQSTPAAASSTPAAETSKPAVQSTATASATGSVSAPHHATVTESVAVTTTVCDEESSKHSVPVVTVTSAHWECPHGCNGTVSTMTKITKPNPSQSAQNPPCNGECHHTEIVVPSSPSNKAHPTPSQGGAKPSGTDVVVPTKSVTPSGSAPVESPSVVVVNAGASASVSGFLAAAGVAVAVFRLL